MENRYIQYLSNHHQAGSGIGDIGKLYKSNRIYQDGFGFSPIVVQEGHGLGSTLQSLFQAVYPLIRSGFNSLGAEAKTVGKNILRDISTKPITSLLKEHGGEAISNLKNKINKKMSGKGVKKSRRRKINSNTKPRSNPKKTIKNKVKRLKHQSHSKVAAVKRQRKSKTKSKKQTPRILDIYD